MPMMAGPLWKPFAPPWRAIAHSAQPIGNARKSSAQIYGIMKAPPPCAAAWPGKRKKFPRPTAEPATARITPTRVPHSICFFSPLMCRLFNGGTRGVAIVISGGEQRSARGARDSGLQTGRNIWSWPAQTTRSFALTRTAIPEATSRAGRISAEHALKLSLETGSRDGARNGIDSPRHVPPLELAHALLD